MTTTSEMTTAPVSKPDNGGQDGGVKFPHLGEAIKRSRAEKNMKQVQLARLVGIPKCQMCRFEHGGNMQLDSVSKIFKAMGIGIRLETDNGLSIPLN